MHGLPAGQRRAAQTGARRRRHLRGKEPLGIRGFDELQRKTNTIIYKGNVLVVRDDVKIASDALLARYDAKGGGLRSVVAEGTVRVRHAGREMTGDKAVFDGAEETIVVSGNTTVRDGSNSISGDRITVFMKEDRILVENSGGRVRAVVVPGQLDR